MTTLTLTRDRAEGMTADERRVIFASSLGTVFEWYDFYLYATLAPFFAALFFPPGNDTAALLSAFATYAAGFLVRPFGAIIFGRIGDLVGRKYTFLVTIVVMGGATFAVGLLPTFATHRLARADPAGHAAPAAGPRARRRVRRRRDLRGRARAPQRARLCDELHPDHGDARLLPGAAGDRGRPLLHRRHDLRRLGLAHSVPGVARPAGVLGLYPAQAQRIAGVQAHEGGRQGLEGAADRELPALPQQQIRAARACSAPPPARAWSGTPGSSTPCSSSRSRSSSTT